ncbi:hypothetical protein FSP39_012197 [Pinctada imbricata]|uniref:Uncharacterized protein n=1 Tax=Pinctada imbricata TaxID=66713 RepID=A0AA89BVI0_PINIB|nr:hypothetical protein FSP39_012197 [Pinctada imbricata]
MERGLKLMEEERDKSEVLAALAMTKYNVGAEEVDSVKSYLFQSSQLSPPSVHGLLALCSLGILYGDTSLTLAVMEELRKLSDSMTKVDVPRLNMMYHIFLEYNTEAGTKHVEECVGEAPENGLLWLLLAQAKLRLTADSDPATVLTAAIAANDCDPNVMASLVVLALAELADGIHRNDLDTKKKALRNAQKLCHLYPGDTENWCILSAAIRSYASQSDDNRLLWRACFYLQWLSMEGPRRNSNLIRWIESQLKEVKEMVTRDS